jgi:hypothetical protein
MKTINSVLKHFGRLVSLQSILTLLPFCMFFSQEALANPKIRTQFFVVYPSAVNTRLDNLPSNSKHCGACHYDFKGGGARNPLGISIQNALPNFPNTDAGKSNAIYSVRLQDPDADGFSTLMEITGYEFYQNIPTFPGLTPANIGQVANVLLSEINAYLIPSSGDDTTPPQVSLLKPNGGETYIGNLATNITWSASDAGGIAAISLFYSDDGGITYEPIVLGLPNTGAYSWTPANRPTTTAVVKIVAADTALNLANDVSDASFSIVSPPGGRVGSTLRDFDMPGTQPHQGGNELASPQDCASCHGNYNVNTEPYFNWQGSMMAHASIDPLFEANMVIANQDAPDSGDMCLRCHTSRAWLAGRSVPTDGGRILPEDKTGVSCELCHRMVDPVFNALLNPTADTNVLNALTFPGSEYGNGMYVIDPNAIQRGPFNTPAAPHSFYVSSFHRRAAFCGTCHDVSNPAFQKDASGAYVANPFDRTATNFSAHFIAPVERTYSEWLHSAYNSPSGVYAPQFAGNKADGYVSTCQDCHMRDVEGHGANPAVTSGTPLRPDLPLHDMTGGSTWIPSLLPAIYSNQVNAAALEAGIKRSIQLLSNAATLRIAESGPDAIKVLVTNQCGHKLPTGYPEGRRIWINVKFFSESGELLKESGAYDGDTGVLTRDAEAKIYEVHPALETNLANALNLEPGPSFHFVLNNEIYSDNRIPPRGFTNSVFAAFGGAPAHYSYADGQHWDETVYLVPTGAVRAEARLFYQSTSKEFIEFLRDENRTNSKGQEMYDLWNENGKCPPTLMAAANWGSGFQLKNVVFTDTGRMRIEFMSVPGTTYTIEYSDSLLPGSTWQEFGNGGTKTATSSETYFEDDFTANSSGSASTTGNRFYRFKYTQ